VRNKNLLNYGLPDLSHLDFKVIKDSLSKKFITNEKFCERFEKKICNLTKSKYAVVCNNGTSALMMSILACNKKNIVAIVPNINFVSIASIISLLKGKLIFCDVNPISGMVDSKALQKILLDCKIKKITPNLFIPIHYAGNSLDTKELSKICKKNKITIIEDGCHSFGTIDNNKNFIGRSKYSKCTTFSFHPVKNITTIEGGAVTTNDKVLYNKLLSIRSHSLKRTSINDPYLLVSPSLNFRLGEVNAAVGIQQLKKLKSFKKKRVEIVNYYIKKFRKFNNYFQILNYESNNIFWHLFVILLNKKYQKKKLALMKFLKTKNIASQIHYKPISFHKSFQKNMVLNNCKNSSLFYKSQLTLPLHVNMKKKDVDYLAKTLETFFKNL